MSTQHLFCRDCGYILDGLRGTCPECGRRFDPDRPATFSRRSPRERAIRKWLHRNRRCRMALVAAIVVLMFTPFAYLDLMSDSAWLLLLLLYAANLTTIYVAALKLNGVRYAATQTCIAVLLTPAFGYGLYVVPKQVRIDTSRMLPTDDPGTD